jgi:FolB domain-containing protein
MKQKIMDTIYINDLKLSCLIGVFGFERKSRQTIIINIVLSVDLNKASKTDNVKDTISYRYIYDQIINFAENSDYYLIEKLAEEIAKICLKNDLVKQVKVRIDKPRALPHANSAGIEIIRTNE